MRIHPLAAGVLIAASLISMAAITVQPQPPATSPEASPETTPEKTTDKPPASPRSSHDAPTRELGRHHNRPIKETDGKTLLWAGGDPEGGEEAIWFDMTDALVDPATFQFGIGKDRIPSIDKPTFVPYGSAELAETRIGDQTDVIGYVSKGIAKAYPLFILDRCEIVNDDFDGTPIGVYW